MWWNLVGTDAVVSKSLFTYCVRMLGVRPSVPELSVSIPPEEQWRIGGMSE